MGDKKLSSVEWLVEQLRKNEFIDDPTELIDEAKAMHKEEIVETARYYFHGRGKLTPQQLYNETFGGQDNE